MQSVATMNTLSEPQFAALVDEIADDPARREQLAGLLREDHSVYDQRGTATTVRMRGWVLLALARVGISDAALLVVLEELDTGTDPYLVAAAARALRSYPNPTAAFAPFVMRAIMNLRYRDDPVSFDRYGEYVTSATGTSPVRELLATLAWLGPRARGVLTEVEALRASHGGLSKKLLVDVDRAVEVIRISRDDLECSAKVCCTLPGGLGNIFSSAAGSRRDCRPIEETKFQDHEGTAITFKEFFRGHPSIIVFFYTRCDNPLKCSLTITKLARVQKLLEVRGAAELIHTAAITYDPGFDLPERLRGYGRSRELRLDARHRMLRTTAGFTALRGHFKLGVNFIESLVNRHRIEAYVLDAEGRVASCFERIHWDESQVVDRAIEVMNERDDKTNCDGRSNVADSRALNLSAPQVFGTLASVGAALLPKCSICWAGYLSVFGIATLKQISYSPLLRALLVAVMLINVATVWLRRGSTRGITAFCLVSAGTAAVVMSRLMLGWERAAVWGVALTFAGSLLNTVTTPATRGHVRESTES